MYCICTFSIFHEYKEKDLKKYIFIDLSYV